MAPALLAALAATSAFAIVAMVVASHAGDIRCDLTLARWPCAHRQPVLIGTMRTVSWVNGIAGIGLISAALALWFWRVRARTRLELLLVAIPGVMLLNGLLKQLFAHPRPYFADSRINLTTYSSP
jgi:hypothetical protein